MFIERIISVLADYLDINESELGTDTKLFLDYDLEDDDIQEIIEKLNEELDVDIDFDEFCELESIEEIAEYIESLD